MTLSDSVDRYVRKKRSAGASFLSGEINLRAFTRFCGDIDLSHLKGDLVTAFLKSTECSAITRLSKFSAVKGFFEHLQMLGSLERCKLVPPGKPSSVRIPYIFSQEEIRKLLAGAERCQSRAFALEGTTLRTSLLLLYATGASLQEVVALRRGNVDLLRHQICFDGSRSRTKRILPIGVPLTDQIARHFVVAPLRSPEAHVLCSKKGSPISKQSLSSRFKHLQVLVGILPLKGRHPRLQDLRYTFAVHRLNAWISAGENLDQLLPALSSYMGYASLSAAEQFLVYTPARFQNDLNKLSPHRW